VGSTQVHLVAIKPSELSLAAHGASAGGAAPPGHPGEAGGAQESGGEAAKLSEQLQQLQDMGFYDREENLRALQAARGNVNAAVERLLACVRREETASETLVNYKKGGVRFVNQLTVAPLYDENDDLAAFMGMLREVDEGLSRQA
ncbi:MAG: hypothetical protein VX017_11190, partial [Pseudomonadota bacterium]|nr:hypothetical protein [Pseudomonadota bacterium]